MCSVVYLCPTTANYECEWEGDASEIENHFAEMHNELIMRSNTLCVNVLQEVENNRLLVSNAGLFLVQTKVCNKTSKLLIRLRFLQLSTKQTQKISYSIEVSNGSHGFTNENCSDVYNPVCNSNGGVEIDFQAIGLISGTNSIENVHVTINVQGVEIVQVCNNLVENILEPEAKTPDPELLLLLHDFDVSEQSSNDEISCENQIILERITKCVNCEQLMFPPIYMCPEGHSVCHSCKNGFCGCCSLLITNLRNFDLEEYSKTIEYRCKYELQGCLEKLKYNQLRKHEIHCRYCIYNCYFCTYEGKYWDIDSHSRIAHPSTKILDDMTGVTFAKGSNFAIINTEGVFYCTSRATDTYVEWKVLFCGPRERCFSCEPGLTMYFGGLCPSMNSNQLE